MSELGSHRTLFEHLPTEIFLQIFSFFSLRELVKAFFDLNSTINSVVRSVRHASHVIRCNDDDAAKLLRLFPIQIGRLLIINAEMIDIRILTNLRSLTFKSPTQMQLDSIRPEYLPILEILHIKGLHTSMNGNTETINNLFEVILSNGFSRLRICTALNIGSLEFSQQWTGSSSLRTLHLNMKTTDDYEKFRSLCPKLRRLTTYQIAITLERGSIPACVVNKRFIGELRKLEQLELENKFIVDINPMALFGNKEPPPRFNNTTINQKFHGKDLFTIRGRILPKTEPYCRASFLIELTIPKEYPFKAPDVLFLDPVYHPSVDERGCCYCCSHHLIGEENWKPTTSLTTFIEATIHTIDSIPDQNSSRNLEIYEEYANNREKFNAKALEFTLSYGRPRD